MVKKKIPVLVGATGVGKSLLAFHAARGSGFDVVCGDAFQVYRGFPVLTAQPPVEWRREVPHHLVGVRDPAEAFSAGDFAREARECLSRLFSSGKAALVVGGSGFYLKVLFEGLGTPAPDPDIRAFARRLVEDDSKEAFQRLQQLSPGEAEKVDAKNPLRLARALERALSGKEGGIPPWEEVQPVFLGLDVARPRHGELLKERIEAMWREGAVLEVETFLSRRPPPEAPGFRIIGVREIQAFLEGKLSAGEAKERMLVRTRQYAKRQRTWFRRQAKVRWLEASGEDPLEKQWEAFRKAWREREEEGT